MYKKVKIRGLMVKKILQKMMDDEQQKYHPAGVSGSHFDSCYNYNIPLGLKTKPQRVETIIKLISPCNFQIRRVETIIENGMTYKPKTRRVETIVADKNEWREYHPAGVFVPHFDSCYNYNIPLGLKTKPQRVETIIKLISPCNFQTRRVETIIENGMTYNPKTRRVETIVADKNEGQKYHPVGVSVPHFDSCYNHYIPLGLKTKF